MHKFGVPQGGVLFGRGFPPLGGGGYPPRGGSGTPPRGAPPTRGGGGGTPPPPHPGGVGGVPRNPEKWVFGTPPGGVILRPKWSQPRVNTDGRTIKIRKVSIWGVHLGENLSIFGAHSFRKTLPARSGFWDLRF